MSNYILHGYKFVGMLTDAKETYYNIEMMNSYYATFVPNNLDIHVETLRDVEDIEFEGEKPVGRRFPTPSPSSTITLRNYMRAMWEAKYYY